MSLEERKLTPANYNPWYCLATLYGESGEADLAAKNRIAWNRWYAAVLTDEQRADLVKKDFPVQELIPFTDVEMADLVAAFKSRSSGKNQSPPTPNAYVDFSRTHFQPIVNFGGYLFANDADFNSTIFSSYANFRSAVFTGLAYFESVVFERKTTFASAIFCAQTHFSWTKFAANDNTSDAVFHSASFADAAHFLGAEFNGPASFEAATFSGAAHFDQAKFLNAAHIDSARFLGKADFNTVRFSGYTRFVSATFSGYANFNSSTFLDYVEFTSASFSEEADFDTSHFEKNGIFCSVTFSKRAYFASAKFSGAAHFSLATFCGPANFKNVQFTATTRFDDARFSANVPDFRGASMHEATEWHGVHWPAAPLEKEQAQEQVYAYERLKQEMEQLKKHEDEQFFFRKELRARRGTMPPRSWAWWLNAAYEDLSNYGQSAGRPFAWMLGLLTIGTLLLGVTPATPDASTVIGLQRAASLNYAYIFSIFPFHNAIAADQKFSNLSGLGQTIFLVETLFGTLLLFLIGLALRNKFRMR